MTDATRPAATPTDAPPLRVAFLGAGPFALPPLASLLESRHEVAAVVTQPDRSGRGHHRHENPLKTLAAKHEAPCLQPANINDEADAIAAIEADLLVTASYGQFLGKRVREAAPLGAINLHGSLLPKYRGAAPVQHAVWNREPVTGVTAFQITRGMDTGPMLGRVETAVGDRETFGELLDRLAELAGPLAVDVCDGLAAGRITPQPQEDAAATLAPKLTKADGLIDFAQPASRVQGQVLATQPWPKPTTFWHDAGGSPPRRMNLLQVTATDGRGEPGTILSADPLLVACGDGAVRLDRVQVAGKAAMDAAAFINGYQPRVGDRLRPTDALD